MPAVIAIANAPQNATRKVALPTGAPPAFAPTAPRIAKNKSDATETPTIIGRPAGDNHAASKGIDAPVVKVAAEVIAACTRTRGSDVGYAQFVPCVRADGVLGHELRGHFVGGRLIEAPRLIDG